MKSYLKTGSVHNEKTLRVDEETGEVVEELNLVKHKYLVSKDKFFLAYSYLIDVLKDCKDLKIKTYAYLLENYKAGTPFQVGLPIKRVMAERFNCSVASISNTLTVLKEEKLVYSPSRGLYMLNPRYAFKGSSKERDKQLKVIIELGCKDC